MLKALISISCLCAVLAANSADKQEFNIVHQEGRHKVLVSVEVDIPKATVLASPRQTNKASLTTFYDFEHHVALYRSASGPICYVERLEDDDVHAELVLLQKLNGAIVRDAPRTLYVANLTLTPEEIEALGGEKLLNFCEGKEMRMLIKENPLDNRQPAQKRSKRSAPVRRRIQTQVHAQTSPSGDGQLAPEAWAIASPDAAVARVGGGSGYAQAQSHVTVETEHENGAKGIRRMSASSSMFNSGPGGSAGHNVPASITSGGGLGSGSSKGYTGFDPSRSAAGFSNFGGSSSSGYSSRTGGLAPVPGSKTYRYKVTYPGGYQSTSWYTGTADGSRSVIEGPTSSDPLHLTAPGTQTGGAGVIQASGPIYGASAQKTSSEFHTIGVGVGHSSGGFSPERAHQQAQHILQSSASQSQGFGASGFDESGSTGSFSTFDSRLGGIHQPYRNQGAAQQQLDDTSDRSEEPAYRQPSQTQVLQSRASEEERIQGSRGQPQYPSPSQPAANLQYPSRFPQQPQASFESAQQSQDDLRTHGSYPQKPATRPQNTYTQTGEVDSLQQIPSQPQQPSYSSRQPQPQQTAASGSRTAANQDESQSLPGRVYPSHQTQTQGRPSGQVTVVQQQQPTYPESQQLVPQTLSEQQTYTQTGLESTRATQTLPVRVPQQTYTLPDSEALQPAPRAPQQPAQVPRVPQQPYSQSGAESSHHPSQTAHVRVPQQPLYAQTGFDGAQTQASRQQTHSQTSSDASHFQTAPGRVPQQPLYAQTGFDGAQTQASRQQTHGQTSSDASHFQTAPGRVHQQQPHAQTSSGGSHQVSYTQQGRIPQQQYVQTESEASRQQVVQTLPARVPPQQVYSQSGPQSSQQTTQTLPSRVPQQQTYVQTSSSDASNHLRVPQQQSPSGQYVPAGDQTVTSRTPQYQQVLTAQGGGLVHSQHQAGFETSQQTTQSLPSRVPQQQTYGQTLSSDASYELRTPQQQLPSGQYIPTDTRTVPGRTPQYQQVLTTQGEESAHSQRPTQQRTPQRHYDGQESQVPSTDGTTQQLVPSGGSLGLPGAIHITQQQSVHVYGSHGDRISTQQGTVGLPQQGQPGTRVTLVGQSHQTQDGQTTQTSPGYLPRQPAEAALQGTVDSTGVPQQTQQRPVYGVQGSPVQSQLLSQPRQVEQTNVHTQAGQAPQRVQQPTPLIQTPSSLLTSAHSMHMEESDMLKMQPQAPEQPLTHTQAGYILPQLHYRPAPQAQQPQQQQVSAPAAPQLQQPQQPQVPAPAPQPQQSRVPTPASQQPASGHIQVTTSDAAISGRRPTRPLPVPAEGQIIQQDTVNVVRIPNGRDASHGSQIVLQPGQAVPGTPYSVPEGLRGTVIQHNIPATGDAAASDANFETGAASALVRPSRPSTQGTSGAPSFIGTSSLVSSGRGDIPPDSMVSSDSRRGAPRSPVVQPGSPQRGASAPVPAPRQENVPSPTDLATDYDYDPEDAQDSQDDDGTSDDDLCTGPNCPGRGHSITTTTMIRQTPIMTIPVQPLRPSSSQLSSGMNGRRVHQTVTQTQTFSSHGMGINGFAAQSPSGVVKPIPTGGNGNGNGCQTIKVSCQVAHGPTQRVRICTPQVTPGCCCDISISCGSC